MDALGDSAIVERMDSEAKVEALEGYLSGQPDNAIFARLGAPSKPMTVSELNEHIDKRPLRRGMGGTLFSSGGTNPFGTVCRANPSRYPACRRCRLNRRCSIFSSSDSLPRHTVLQSADKTLAARLPEEIVVACLLHDVAKVLIKAHHGWWAAQLFEPYTSRKVSFAIRYHQAPRFYPDPSVGYEYPRLYNLIFGTHHRLQLQTAERGSGE